MSGSAGGEVERQRRRESLERKGGREMWKRVLKTQRGERESLEDAERSKRES